ncbi:MAG: hypothetical protein R3B48_25065 [Kofleriaceae bacterium]
MKRSVLVAVLTFFLAACPAATPRPISLRLKAPPPTPQRWSGEVREARGEGMVWVMSPFDEAGERWILSLVNVRQQVIEATYIVPNAERFHAIEATSGGGGGISTGIEWVIIGSVRPGPRPGPIGDPDPFLSREHLNVAANALAPLKAKILDETPTRGAASRDEQAR